MGSPRPHRKSCSYRIRPEVDAQVREFIRLYRGHPLFLELGPFIEEAIQRHLAATQRRLVELGAAVHPSVQVPDVHETSVTRGLDSIDPSLNHARR